MTFRPSIAAAIIAGAAFSPCFSAAGAQQASLSPLNAATLCARAAAAAGHEPANFRETIETTSAEGSTYSSRLVKRGPDWQRTFLPPAAANTIGAFDGRMWHRDDNGIAYLSRQAAAPPMTPLISACSASDTVTLAKVGGKAVYRVAETVPTFGLTQTDFDPTTWLAVDQIVGTSMTNSYGSYRNDDGWTHADRIRTRSANGTVSESRVSEFTTIVGASDVTPTSLRQLVEFPAGATSVALPTTFTKSEPFVRVTIGGRGYDFTLSTRDTGISIDPSIARDLGFKQETKTVTLPEMRIGSLVMHAVVAQIHAQQFVADDHVRAVGALGFDMLAQLVVSIDYRHETITATKPEAFAVPTNAEAFALPLDLSQQRAEVAVRVGDFASENWTIATADGTAMVVPARLVTDHPETLAKGHENPITMTQFRDTKAGDNENGRYMLAYRLGKVAIGPNLIVHDTDAYASTSDSAGRIGNGFLRLFRVEIDYPDSTMYLIPEPSTRSALHNAEKP